MPLHEAATVGLPVIAPYWPEVNGYNEFLNSGNSYRIDIEPLLTSASEQRDYELGQFWAQPVLDSVKQQMRYVVTHAAEAAATGQRARAEMLHQYSIDAVTTQVLIPQLHRIFREFNDEVTCGKTAAESLAIHAQEQEQSKNNKQQQQQQQ